MRTPLFPLAPLAFAAPLALALWAPSARAQECGVSLDLYEDAPLVADLKPRETLDLLERGDLAGTAARARDALDVNALSRALAKKRVKAGRAFGEDDIRAALAVAIVRSGGTEGLKGTLGADAKAAQKAKNLDDARKLLQAQARIHAGDPVVTTYLGEALAAVGEREKARGLLEDLAAADLIVSAEGWAALAAVSDGDIAAEARTRCAAMARDASTCVAPVSPASSNDAVVAARSRS